MKDENLIQSKSYEFAVLLVPICLQLMQDRKEYVLSRQLLKSGTSIGANVEEALGGQSRADFIAKLSIAYKEARETSYWLRLLKDTGFLKDEDYELLFERSEQLCRIMTAILKSSKGI